jgi:hypothetical protein
MTEFGAERSLDCAERAPGKAFRKPELLCRDSPVPIDLFLACENQAGNIEGKEFAADALVHARADCFWQSPHAAI